MSEIIPYDGIISDDGKYDNNSELEFKLLPPGNYNFRVISHEQANSSKKNLPMVVLTLLVYDEKNSSNVKTNLMRLRSCEWKLSEFFRSIGQKKRGEDLKMDWSKVDGAEGRLRIKHRTYTGRDGKQREVNEVDKFFDQQPGKASPKPSKDEETPW